MNNGRVAKLANATAMAGGSADSTGGAVVERAVDHGSRGVRTDCRFESCPDHQRCDDIEGSS